MNPTMNPAMSPTQGKGARTLLLIVAVLASPLALAAVLHLSGWRPAGRPNGELLALPTPALAADAEGRWRLAVAGTGPCDAACAALLDEARRVHVALYKQMPRLARLWLGDAPSMAVDGPRLRRWQPDLAVEPMPDALSTDPAGHRLYLFDPEGRLVLRYVDGTPARDILHDLERLLRR